MILFQQFHGRKGEDKDSIYHERSSNKGKTVADTTSAKHTTSEELEPYIVDKIENMLDKKFHLMNGIQDRIRIIIKILLSMKNCWKYAINLNQEKIAKLLQSKDNENNSNTRNFKETQQALIEHIMELEKSLKVSMHQAAVVAAASSD